MNIEATLIYIEDSKGNKFMELISDTNNIVEVYGITYNNNPISFNSKACKLEMWCINYNLIYKQKRINLNSFEEFKD